MNNQNEELKSLIGINIPISDISSTEEDYLMEKKNDKYKINQIDLKKDELKTFMSIIINEVIILI